MSIVSMAFLIFIAISLCIYYITPRTLQWIVLLIFSVVFFVFSSSIKMLIILSVIILINWISALITEKNNSKRKLIYVLTITLNLALLVFFKDINFFPDTLNAIAEFLGYPTHFPRISILAPIGISYFMLNLIGYITEVYWGKFPAQKNIGKIFLFTSYFPLMTSGPFIKYDQTGKNLLEKHEFNYDRIVSGAERILWGFFKKLVIAERLNIIVNTVYSDFITFGGSYILIAAVCFVMQLYTDFSGAIDIALGVSECFGIVLPENFDIPFWSTNISEFWRRWHITLGNWLREYVFYPLLRSNAFRRLKKWCTKKIGKSYEKKFNLPVYMAMFITWFLIGFWHGGKWNYIFGSGLYYWFVITVSEICSPLFSRIIKILDINTNCSSYRLFQRFRTFCIFTFGLSFFRASSLTNGVLLWKSALLNKTALMINSPTVFGLGLNKSDMVVLVVALGILVITALLRLYLQQSVRAWFNQQNILFKGSILMIAAIGVIIFGIYGPGVTAAEFIYQQF